MTDIHLYGFEGSTYVRSATIACRELGLEYELLPLEFGKPSHLALHPFGKMPILQHGSRQIYETPAILSYLNDLADKGDLVPDEALQRARMWQAICLCIDYAYPALVKATFADDINTIDSGPAERCLDAINALMEPGAFLAGEHLSLADLVFEPMLSHYLKTVPIASAQLERRPRLAKWHQSMRARPATLAAYGESHAA